MLSSLTHWLFKCVLFNFDIFVDFPVFSSAVDFYLGFVVVREGTYLISERFFSDLRFVFII